MRHTISVLVENKFGVLARVAGLFSARGYNIASLAVSETLDPEISYMTIVVEAKDAKILEQINKQLNKLIDVITVTDFTKKEHLDRELVLAKINYAPKDRRAWRQFLINLWARLFITGRIPQLLKRWVISSKSASFWKN
jgi:acetolactate synthase-1/3 small subunit